MSRTSIRRLYLVPNKAEIDRRKKLVDPTSLVEVWQDLYTPDIVWLGEDAARRVAYGVTRERSVTGLFWMGEESKAALDRIDEPLSFLLALADDAVPIYYGPRLADVESLPREESLKARVLSAHGIAVAWATYDPSGGRDEYRPSSPTDPTFYLRRPRGPVAHLWRLFRTKREALIYVTERSAMDPEAMRWAEALAVEDFDGLLERFGKQGSAL